MQRNYYIIYFLICLYVLWLEKKGTLWGRSAARVQRVVVAASPQIIKKPARALRHFDRSEAEWRNLLPLMVRAALRREISRLRVSSERLPSAPYRHAAPLEMTVAAGTPIVISTVAKRSGEISLHHDT